MRGVEIAEVDEGSLADKAGLAMGEVIVEVRALQTNQTPTSRPTHNSHPTFNVSCNVDRETPWLNSAFTSVSNLPCAQPCSVEAGRMASGVFTAGWAAKDVDPTVSPCPQVNSRVVLNAKCARVVKLMNGCDGLLRLRVAQREDVTSIVAPPGTALRTVLLKRPRATVMCTEITPETLRLAGEYYELNLAGKGLTSAPSELGAFANVQVLDLADNAVRWASQDFALTCFSLAPSHFALPPPTISPNFSSRSTTVAFASLRLCHHQTVCCREADCVLDVGRLSVCRRIWAS